MTDVQLRERFLTEFAENISRGLYDDDDIRKVKGDLKFVELFLKHNRGDLDKSLKSMHVSLEWRKSFCVKDITSSSFPSTFLSANIVFFCNKDKDGHRILHIQFSKMKKDSTYLEGIKRFLVWQIEKAFQANIVQKFVVLMDMTDYPNIDTSFVKFIIQCFTTYFPCLLEYLLMVEPPWRLSTSIKGWLTSEQKKMVSIVTNKTSLSKYITADQLFTHLGGTCEILTFLTPQQSETKEPQLESSTEENSSLYNFSRHPSKRNIGTFLSRQCSEEFQSIPAVSLPSHLEANVTEDDQSIHNVTLNPPECITFDENNELGDSVSPLTITNSTLFHVAYKVKTTSPDIFRVRPTMGIIPPQSQKKVSVTLLAGKQYNTHKDKFLVMLMVVKDASTKEEGNLVNLWRTTQKNPEEFLEYKLNCKVNYLRSSSDLTPNGTLTANKVSREDVIEQLNQINRNQMVITILLMAILAKMFLCPLWGI